MTREEAIKYGKNILIVANEENDADAIDFTKMAITALEQEPCEDCISRAEAIEQYTRWYVDFVSLYDNGNFQDVLKNLPSIQPKPKTDTWSIKEVADALEKHGLRMSEISETEIKSMTKEQNYMRGYADGKSDVLEKIIAEIQENINYNKKMNYQGIVAGLLLTIDIIDKYTAEKE